MSSFFSQLTNDYLIPGVVDFSQRGFWLAAGCICFNPLYWNTVAQNEYHNKTITKVLGGRRYLGCYLLAVSIFSLGILRDHVYNEALKAQPTHPLLEHPAVRPAAAALFLAGNVFVLSSMWALGITGTYLGDYFGILMDHMVTGFPFNVMANPMYWGSSMSFVAVALWYVPYPHSCSVRFACSFLIARLGLGLAQVCQASWPDPQCARRRRVLDCTALRGALHGQHLRAGSQAQGQVAEQECQFRVGCQRC